MKFRDREEAGGRLAAELDDWAKEHPVVVALPRGGVPVGHEVARRLGAPLDILVVRKVGVPWHPELGMGAIAEGGFLSLTQEVIEHIGISEEELSDAVEEQRVEVEQRVRRFRGDRPRIDLQGRVVILVDDGIATGGTVRAAIQAIRAAGAKSIVLAVPVASADVLESLSAEVDHLVCLLVPRELYAIGLWYEDFRQVPDEAVTASLGRAGQEASWSAST